MARLTEDVDMETEEIRGQHKGKGGNLLKDTSEHFEHKYRAAVQDEAMVQMALATDTHLDMEVDAETMTRHPGHRLRPTGHLREPRAYRGPPENDHLGGWVMAGRGQVHRHESRGRKGMDQYARQISKRRPSSEAQGPAALQPETETARGAGAPELRTTTATEEERG